MNKDKVPGRLISEERQPNGDIIQTYEVEILGKVYRYFHLKELSQASFCRFTQQEISLN